MRPNTTDLDWIDVMTYQRSLLEMHGVTVTLKLVPGFYRFQETVMVCITAGAPVMMDDGKAYHWTAVEHWPCHGHRTLQGLVYRLLYDLDMDACKLIYRQAKLPLSPP